MSRSFAILALLLLPLLGPASRPAAAEEAGPPPVRVGSLVYAQGKQGVCFSDGFLALLARETSLEIDRGFHEVSLASDELFAYPFVVMTGEGRFTLSDDEQQNLKRYLEQGGFLLASAGCSNQAWASSLRGVLNDLFGSDALMPVDTGHPIFHTVYDIDHIRLREHAPHTPAISVLELDGSVRAVFSPMGLNDTANAGGGCCCCGGNEVQDAQLINANLLAYALTH